MDVAPVILDGEAWVCCLAPSMHSRLAMLPFFEDDDDPKKPRPVESHKKREGWPERGESRKDEGRDHHRHVHVRC